MQRKSIANYKGGVILELHALQRAYQFKLLHVGCKWPCAGMVHICLLSNVHRERAKGHAAHALTPQLLQGGKGVDHPEELIEVHERNIDEDEASDSGECREEEREAGVKGEVS